MSFLGALLEFEHWHACQPGAVPGQRSTPLPLLGRPPLDAPPTPPARPPAAARRLLLERARAGGIPQDCGAGGGGAGQVQAGKDNGPPFHPTFFTLLWSSPVGAHWASRAGSCREAPPSLGLAANLWPPFHPAGHRGAEPQDGQPHRPAGRPQRADEEQHPQPHVRCQQPAGAHGCGWGWALCWALGLGLGLG